MYYIYILHSKLSDKYYVGYTNNLTKRVIDHNTNPRNTYTSKHRPWILVASMKVGEDRAFAMKIEKFIKKQKSKKFIKKLISQPDLIPQLVRVPKRRD